VREIKSNLFSRVLNLKTLGVLIKRDRDLLEQVSGYYEAFRNLEDDLEELRHPFSQIPDMPYEFKQLVMQYELEEVLGKVSYDYSHNDANRKHNLVEGTKKMNGKVYQPGDLIDLTKEFGSNGWREYRNGWVIAEGEVQWQFGGGLCGSATMAFTPSWKAGLEVIKRYAHSVYYKDLYPEESFGLDATIYRGAKNLVMKNSTNDPVLFYVEDDPEAEEITLYLIGNAPYYTIEIEGPIQVGWNTYKWIRRMTQFDGKVVEDELVTRYGLVY
jgi:vancomycin resistance protein YoaR